MVEAILWLMCGLSLGASLTSLALTLRLVKLVHADQRSKRSTNRSKQPQPARPVDASRDPSRIHFEVLRLKEQGLGVREIARQLGISHSTVIYHLKKAK